MSKTTRDPQNLPQIVAKSRWTPEDANDVVKAWRRSGLSRRAFCDRHGIDAQRLARWTKLLPEPPAFAEVVVVSGPATSRAPIIIEIGSARVVVDHDVDDDHLARVLRIVGSVC